MSAIRVHIKYRARSACKNYSFNSFYSCSKKSRVQAPRERPRREQNPCDPCAYKKQSKIRVQNYSLNSDYSCSKKSRVQAPRERPRREQDPCDPCDPCAYKI